MFASMITLLRSRIYFFHFLELFYLLFRDILSMPISFISPFTGVPPLVSRRALETLTYLARNHPLVAKLLLEFKLPQLKESSSSDEERGKAVMLLDEQKEYPDGQASFTLLLSLLNQSLYLRSVAHLEQVCLSKQLLTQQEIT